MVGEVTRNIPKINATLEDRQVDYQPNMVGIEGKMFKHNVSILKIQV